MHQLHSIFYQKDDYVKNRSIHHSKNNIFILYAQNLILTLIIIQIFIYTYENYKSNVITIYYEINKVTLLTIITISKYLL